jgi:predicted lipoprotein with Yx(FWY)xxD motif
MMSVFFRSLAISSVIALASAAHGAETQSYVPEAMPPGFQVVISELDGPIFADPQGRTLYTWPRKGLRNGSVGEQKGRPECDNTKYTETSGFMSPYPPGLELPEVETRPTCVEVWPPVTASTDAKAVGKWSILARKDGAQQWAYDGYPLYTSVLDEMPGDTRGSGGRSASFADTGAYRELIGPRPDAPAQFGVFQTPTGRMLGLANGFSVYAYDKDSPARSNCTGPCLKDWQPVLAAATAVVKGDWSTIDREPGVKQWAFRGRPVYTRIADDFTRSLEGSDVPGWHNVYTQLPPARPKEFTVQQTHAGQVLADARGSSLYFHNCTDDALDQLACDHPGSPQAYRIAICGGGDAERCLRTFPYVIAAKDAKSENRTWTILSIDPKTGRHAAPGQADALRVWAYRGRPVFTYAGDKKPGQVVADGWGEFNGARNGFKAFILRDDFGALARGE